MINDMDSMDVIQLEHFRYCFNDISERTTKVAEDHGWTIDQDPVNLTAKICLVHSELSEAVEAIRIGNPESKKIPTFTLLEEELADVILRIMHIGYRMDLEVGGAVVHKLLYNQKRPYKHGGKLL